MCGKITLLEKILQAHAVTSTGAGRPDLSNVSYDLRL